MTFDQIMSAEPTELEYISKRLYMAICEKEDWRCYSSKELDVMPLIGRFLRAHCMIKGFLSDEVLALRPATIFYWRDQTGGVYKGATFLNGAILVARPDSETKVVSLFVADETATKWGYPKGYHFLKDLI